MLTTIKAFLVAWKPKLILFGAIFLSFIGFGAYKETKGKSKVAQKMREKDIKEATRIIEHAQKTKNDTASMSDDDMDKWMRNNPDFVE